MATADVVALLLELIVESGGKLAGSQSIEAIRKRAPALRKIVYRAGGLKMFCSQHNALEFVTVAGGDGFIQRRVAAPDIVEALLALVDEHGGSLAGSEAVLALRQRGVVWQKVVDDAGGLKKFCASQVELEFVTKANSDGFIRRKKAELSKPLKSAPARTPSTSSTSSGASSSSDASASECSSVGEEPTSAHVHNRESALRHPRQVAGATQCNLGNVRTMYHATSQSNATSILCTGELFPGVGGYLGPGIYFCKDPSTAMQRAQPKSTGELVVLELQVQMGRTQLFAERKSWTENILLEAGFHSMKALGKGNDCYMIPDNGFVQIDTSTIRIHEI